MLSKHIMSISMRIVISIWVRKLKNVFTYATMYISFNASAGLLPLHFMIPRSFHKNELLKQKIKRREKDKNQEASARLADTK